MWQKKKISTIEDAWSLAINRLAVSDRSSGEILTALYKRDCPEKIAQAVLTKLLEQKYVDDEKLCQNICDRWQSEGAFGKRLLQVKLLKRGISSDIVSRILREIDCDEYAKVKKAFLAHVKTRKLSDEKSRNKLLRHLIGKGFDYHTIRQVINSNTDLAELPE